LAREVKDPVVAAELQLVLDEVHALHREPASILLLALEVVVIGERIPADGLVATVEERLQQMGADEAGGARDDVAHGAEW
jgi:hypothetical protein